MLVTGGNEYLGQAGQGSMRVGLKIWSLPYDKIINFLLERRKEATDPSEYYITLPYLSNEVEANQLDITFENFTWERPIIPTLTLGLSRIEKTYSKSCQ